MSIRVQLDTSAVRGIVHDDPECRSLNGFGPIDEGLSIGLADNAIPELVVALFEERIRWEQWKAGVQRLDSLLDPASPIFPNDEESARLFWPPSARVTISRAEHSRAMWQTMVRAETAKDLEAGPTFRGADGVEYQIRSSRELAERLSEEHRERWRETIRKIQQQIVQYHPSQEYVAELLFKRLFDGRPDAAELRRKNDGYVRSYARFLSLALAKGESYNPDSTSRRGDSFDLELLQGLAAPALICTLDRRLIRHVRATGTAQARQVVTPAELVEEARARKLNDRIT